VSTNRVDPASFLLPGGRTGLLLIHGFTGAPPELRLLGEHLQRRGLTVAAPLLPGHGTSLQDMNRCRWRDWTGCVEQALAELRQRCSPVFVGGLSMGAVLALHLAARHPRLPGALLYAPALWPANRLLPLTPIARRLLFSWPKPVRSDLQDPRAEDRLWHYDADPLGAAAQLWRGLRQVRRAVPAVRCPLLVVESALDQSLRPGSGRRLLQAVGSHDVELLTLRRAGHCLTADQEWRTVAERSWGFLRRLGAGG